MLNYLLAGVGGQGTVLASRIIAQCAMNSGMAARTAETIGMAQRGGSVLSHVRIGEGIQSPLVPLGSADVLMGFEPGEAVRSFGYLKEGGKVVVSSMAVKPVTDSLSSTDYDPEKMLRYLKAKAKEVIVVDGSAVCEKMGTSKVLNLALLGAAIESGVLDFSRQQVEQVIREKIPPRFTSLNLRALDVGADCIVR